MLACLFHVFAESVDAKRELQRLHGLEQYDAGITVFMIFLLYFFSFFLGVIRGTSRSHGRGRTRPQPQRNAAAAPAADAAGHFTGP